MHRRLTVLFSLDLFGLAHSVPEVGLTFVEGGGTVGLDVANGGSSLVSCGGCEGAKEG